MKNLCIAAFMLAGPAIAYAYPEVVFNAESQCLSQLTGTGTRYVPPCSFTASTYYADRNQSYTSSALVQNGLFKTNFQYRFVCESIRPLSLRYTLSADLNAVSTSRITGSIGAEKNSIELTHDFSRASLVFDSLSGASGFQAIKPGCKLTVDQLVTYPEPRYYGQLASHLATLNNQFATLLGLATPSTDYLQLLSAIDNATSAFELLQFDLEDEFLLDVVNDSITQLTTSRNVLNNQCRSGSNTTLCSKEVANIRSFVDYRLSFNETNIRDLYNFVNEQSQWLSSYELGRDKTLLNSVAAKLRSQL